MKRVFFVLIICGLTQLLNAQSDPVSKIFNQYAEEEGFTTVNISPGMFKMLAKIDPDDKDLQKISELKEVRILTQEGKEGRYKDVNFYEEIYNQLDKSLYKEVMVVKEADEHVNMLVREDNGVISEFLMIVTSDDENVLINIKGDIDLAEIDRITGGINLDLP
ncbi:MAG: DUF4252 domain-containing protein [Bacteroidales bacterium]|nr:MAG: DUF4252 domain-containing protein [Bacteroidales bacterium]